MEATTTTRTITNRHEAARVIEKLTALRDRATKRGWNVDLDWNLSIETHPAEDDRPATTTYTITVTYGGSFGFDGGWQLVAVADSTATDSPLVFTFGDDIVIDGEIDMSRCDHCGRAIRRNRVLILDDENGRRVQVGGSCSVDFLGHDPEWAFWIGEAVEIDSVEPSSWPVEMVVDAAIEAYRIGYRKSGESECNRDIVVALLTGRIANRYWSEVRNMLAAAPAATLTSDEVLAWMIEQDGTGNFGSNLATIARSTSVTAKVVGLVAYAPAGVDRWRDQMAAKAAERAAAEAARAEATPVPVTSKRMRIEGTIVTMKNVRTDFGVTTKIRVVTDAGWACWGSLPTFADCGWKSATGEKIDLDDVIYMSEDELVAAGIVHVDQPEIGDRIAFDAKIERSADDELFGFYSRPTKAAVVARAATA